MKGRGEAALAGDEVRATFENLRGQTSGHASRLAGEGASHIKPAGRITTRDDLDRADRLRTRLLRGVKRILGGGGARLDLRHVEVTREPLLFLDVGELRVLLVNIERFLRIGFLLRSLDRREVRARHGSREGLPRKFVVGFERGALSFRRSFFRANAPPHVGLPCGTGGDAIYPTL